MLKKDQFYKDLLDGLSLFYESRFITDIRNTALKFPVSELGNALNRRQTASKLWLLDTLFDCHGAALGKVHILGGWYGVLAALFIHDPRFEIERITSFDLDPTCAPIANSLNATNVERGLFEPITADILDLQYVSDGVRIDTLSLKLPDILINTSCEHLDDFDDWFAALPNDTLLVLQSNDYFSEPEHVNSVPDLAAFKRQAPLSTTLFEGALEFDKYTRFMLIGRK
ncbi:MAG: class I SAM-dependent methyltransferase [Alphaproteobacteria bacterium]|jgi:hypothetical protein|nr:class I SAM-dependent methyltransferase [Alphaproteobacteria bacterium]